MQILIVYSGSTTRALRSEMEVGQEVRSNVFPSWHCFMTSLEKVPRYVNWLTGRSLPVPYFLGKKSTLQQFMEMWEGRINSQVSSFSHFLLVIMM